MHEYQADAQAVEQGSRLTAGHSASRLLILERLVGAWGFFIRTKRFARQLAGCNRKLGNPYGKL